MIRHNSPLAFALLASTLVAAPLTAQAPTVIYGRVENAVTRAPVAEASILAPDSSSTVFSDSLGNFAIQLPPGSPLVLHTEGVGYIAQQFELSDDAPDRLSILLLEPAPVQLPGVTVVSEAAVAELATNLEQRRNSYGRAMQAFDRTWLNRFGPVGGTAFDLVKQRIPRMSPCGRDGSQICVPGRGPTFSNPNPTSSYGVCIDGWASFAPIYDLETLPIESVALVEIYYRSQIRVYTIDWMRYQARHGMTRVLPLWMGC